MIELPSDLAEVLKTVQKNENGTDITFPNGNEDLLADLAAAWDNWNKVAESRIQTIIDAAKRAMEHMSGPAAEQYEAYLQKYAGRDDSHAATTLLAGQAMATNLHGSARAVIAAKKEMVRELAYAKEYMQQHPEGKHDDIAKSEGIKTAAQTYHTYIGQVGSGVDSMLRKSAGHIESMTGAGKSCALGGGAGGSGGGPGGGGPGSSRVGLDGLGPNGLPLGVGPAVLPDGTSRSGTGPNGLAGPLGPDGLPIGLGPGGLPAGSRPGGFGGPGGGGDGKGSPGAGSHSMPNIPVGKPPQMPDFGDGRSGGDGSGIGSPKPTAETPRIQPFVPLRPTMPDLGGPGPGLSPGGQPGGGPDGCFGPDGKPVFTMPTGPDVKKLGLDGLLDHGPQMSGPAGPGLAPFGSGPGAGSFGGGGGGGGGGLAAGLGAGGLGSALGSSLAGAGSSMGAGASALTGAGAAASRLGTSTGAGSAAGKAGLTGAGTAAGTAGRPGAAGMHAPGGLGGARGGGRKDGKSGNRFVRPTRFGCEGEEEEEALRTDRGIVGQATEVEPRDKNWHRMRQRWVDEARTPEHLAAHEAETAGPTGADSPLVAQLASAILGTPAEGTAEGGASADSSDEHGTAAGGSGLGRSGAAEPAPATEPTSATGGDGEDQAYLDRARSVAARRGRPDEAPAGEATAPATTATRPAPLREEEGFQVPSPFLRAALARLAAGGGGA
ncbi:hypothetical protein ABT095_22295 [Kitasatospora sp. NPDC002227]|uniref:WXG100-like domain-containing protein n=1 Tax=Kitasatospora sp. NPDC002227 TaxID=3154773 RepID=UPI003329E726